MASTALFDIPRLTERIKAIAATYTGTNNTPNNNIENTTIYLSLRGVLRNILLTVQASDPKYWAKGGIRMIPYEEVADCMRKVTENSIVLGEGFYGRVLNVQTPTCIDNIPKDSKHFGLKIENLKADYDVNQVPERLKEVTDIAREAGDMGIGPAFYDVFVTTDKTGSVQIIKAFEAIDGKSWSDTEWESPAKREQAMVQLNKAIHAMNKAGIIHHDLHSGNVMVNKEGRVYIIDYDLAKRVDDEESSSLNDFADKPMPRWEPKGVASNKGCLYVYKQLIAEGSIKLTAAKNNNKRKTNKNNRKTNARN